MTRTLGPRPGPWQLSVPGDAPVRLAAHGAPELGDAVLTDQSSAAAPDAPIDVALADPSQRLTPAEECRLGARMLFRVGKQQREVVLFRGWQGTASKPLPDGVLGAISRLRAADTTTLRFVLADLLEQEGLAAEAEYVRLEVALLTIHDASGGEAFARLTRFKELSAVVGTTFRYLLGRDLDGCAGPAWSFRCRRRADLLLETDAPNLRLCDVCAKPVVVAGSEAEAETLAGEGVWVSFTDSMVEQNG